MSTTVEPLSFQKAANSSAKPSSDSGPGPDDFSTDGMAFADAFEGAIKVRVGNNAYNVLPLSTDDYAPWCEELTAAMKAQRGMLIPSKATAEQEWRIKVNISELEIIPDDIASSRIVFRAAGTKRVIVTALKNAGVSEEDAVAFMKTRPVRANEMLAVRLSGLYSRQRFEAIYWYELGLPDPFDAQVTSAGGRAPTFTEAQGKGDGSTPFPESGPSGKS